MLTKTVQNYISLLEEKIYQKKASITCHKQKGGQISSKNCVKYAQNIGRYTFIFSKVLT